MSGEMRVQHLGDDRFAIDVRGHRITVDQPVSDGGQDTGPTPVELFVGSLAACVAHYARRYLARHDIDTSGFEVTCDYTTAGGPARVDSISVRITPPPALPADRVDALLAVASHCTVHNTITSGPDVDVTLEPAAGRPAA